jgi:hypothetical protein
LIFLANMAVVYFFGPMLTKGIYTRLASGKGIGIIEIYNYNAQRIINSEQ